MDAFAEEIASGAYISRYDLRHVMRRLEQAQDAEMAGDLHSAVKHLLHAVARLMDHIRVKEDGRI